MRVPLGQGAFKRSFGREAEIKMLNRFFEQNPTNQVDGVALLSRPGTTYEEVFGTGPIRATFTLDNLFESDLFLVSAQSLYRYDVDGNTQLISGSVASNGNPRMRGVSGAGYQRLFIADGQSLQFYGGESYTAVLTHTPGAIDDDVVIIDGVYYQFTSGSVDAGTPAGTLANPWLVDSSGTDAAALANLRAAVNANGTAGTQYSTALTANPRVESNANTATTVTVRNRGGGPPITPINVSVTATGGADGLAWGSGSLTASGLHALSGIATPDDVGIVSVAVLGSYVLCVVANSQRVYFIEPGAITIDPLNFFEIESEPDQVIEAMEVGDQIWFFGTNTTEPWYLQGTNPDAPFQKVGGRPFSRGVIEGTVVKLAGVVYVVGDDKIVYRISGGPEPISNPGISERIRAALKAERENS